MSAEGGTRAVIAALLANCFIAVTKFAAFALTGASSMLAEAIHSVADSGNQVLLLVGGRRAQRGATPEHPFGYGRERYIFGFIVAVVLFSVGGLFALYEAYHKWHEVHEGKPNGLLDGRWWWVPLVVLVAAIVAESFSFRTAIVESNKTRGRQSWKKFIRSAKAPELPVILLEDFAALIGLVFALFGVGMTLITRNGSSTSLGTAMIGILLVLVAIDPRRRDQEPAARRVRRPGEHQPDRGRARRHPRGRPHHPHEDHAHGPGGDPGRGQDRGPRHRERRGRRRGDQPRRGDIREAEPMVTSLYLEPDIYDADYVPAPDPTAPARPAIELAVSPLESALDLAIWAD